MRWLGAELLAQRRRAATYVVLAVLLVVMALIYLLVAITPLGEGDSPANALLRFPDAYSGLAQMIFGLGGLLGVAYAAAVAGADWNWGIPRLVVSRGESRIVYVGVKAIAVAIMLGLGVLVAYLVGIVLVFTSAAIAGQDAGNPFAGRGLADLAESVALGYPVLLERAAIAFAVAILLKSQLAGIVVGIVLYIGEGILSSILLGLAIAERGFRNMQPFGPEWYQYLPFSIGDSVLTRIADTGSVDGGFEGFFLRPVPLEAAMAGVVLYGVIAMVVALVSVWRAEITV